MGIHPQNLEYMCHRADIQIWAHCDLKWSSDGLLKKNNKARCGLKWDSDGHLKKSKDRQRTTSDCKIEIVTRFDTDYFFIESFRKQQKV
jgi:hypothetical protein